MAHWVRQTVYLLLITFSINAAGMTFGREILEDGPTGSESVVTTASATHDKQSDSGIDAKVCDHRCHNPHLFGRPFAWLRLLVYREHGIGKRV